MEAIRLPTRPEKVQLDRIETGNWLSKANYRLFGDCERSHLLAIAIRHSEAAPSIERSSGETPIFRSSAAATR